MRQCRVPTSLSKYWKKLRQLLEVHISSTCWEFIWILFSVIEKRHISKSTGNNCPSIDWEMKFNFLSSFVRDVGAQINVCLQPQFRKRYTLLELEPVENSNFGPDQSRSDHTTTQESSPFQFSWARLWWPPPTGDNRTLSPYPGVLIFMTHHLEVFP